MSLEQAVQLVSLLQSTIYQGLDPEPRFLRHVLQLKRESWSHQREQNACNL